MTSIVSSVICGQSSNSNWHRATLLVDLVALVGMVVLAILNTQVACLSFSPMAQWTMFSMGLLGLGLMAIKYMPKPPQEHIMRIWCANKDAPKERQ